MDDIKFKDLALNVCVYSELIDVLIWDDTEDEVAEYICYQQTELYDILCDISENGFSEYCNYIVSDISCSILQGKSYMRISLHSPK